MTNVTSGSPLQAMSHLRPMEDEISEFDIQERSMWEEPVGFCSSTGSGDVTMLDIKISIPVVARAITDSSGAQSVLASEDAEAREDLRLIAERHAEARVSHADVKARLRRDALLPD